MIGKNIVESKVAALAQVAEILEERKAAGEIGFEQQACLNYSNKFCKTTRKEALKLIDELMKNPKVKEASAVKIADLLPSHESQLVAILQKDRCELSKGEMAEVLKLVSDVPRVEKVVEAVAEKAAEKAADAPTEKAEKKEN